MNNKSCAANDKNIAVSKETEFLKKYWNHVSEKASGHILGLCKNYFFCLFYLWSTLEWFFLPRLSQFTAHCQSLHNHSSHTRCLLGQGSVKVPKVQKMWGFCPGSTPLPAACPHWGAAGKEEGFAGLRERMRQESRERLGVERCDSSTALGRAVLRDLGWQSSEPVEGKEFV